MTHQRTIETAVKMTITARETVENCPGVSPQPLTRYWKACCFRSELWQLLLQEQKSFNPRITATVFGWDSLLREISTSGILIRVASSLLRAIGEQRDVPLAVDVADRTMESYFAGVEAAIGAVSRVPSTHTQATCLEELDAFGSKCDRLSDLFCGSLSYQLGAGLLDYAVDRERAEDYSQTYGDRPRLLMLPAYSMLGDRSREALVHGEIAEVAEEALFSSLSVAG